MHFQLKLSCESCCSAGIELLVVLDDFWGSYLMRTESQQVDLKLGMIQGGDHLSYFPAPIYSLYSYSLLATEEIHDTVSLATDDHDGTLTS